MRKLGLALSVGLLGPLVSASAVAQPVVPETTAPVAGAPGCRPAAGGTDILPGGDDVRARCFLLGWEGPDLPAGVVPSSGRAALLGSPLRRRWTVSSVFGERRDPILGSSRFHAGIDLPGLAGTPVSASGPGRVLVAGWAGGYGLMVEIDHGNDTVTRYGHLERILVAPGSIVQAGQPIGLLGSTGRSTGPHLHYEVRLGGVAIDPRARIWAVRWTEPDPFVALARLPEVAERAGWAREDATQLPVSVIR